MFEFLVFMWKVLAAVVAYTSENPEVLLILAIITAVLEYIFQ